MNKTSLSSNVLPFGILDLCKRHEAQSPGSAIRDMLNLAEFADKLGYNRYWVAEHHVPYAVSSAPELLLPLIAARTKRLRIGTGGMIIRYYSPYRVAEIASTLQTISAERFDLGLCRGPGVIDDSIAQELVSGNSWELNDDAFFSKIKRTVALIRMGKQVSNGIQIHTPADTLPPIWYLGTNPHILELAKKMGIRLAIPLFISKDEDKALAVNNLYKSRVTESDADLKSILAVSVVCADTDDQAMLKHQDLINNGNMQSNFVGSYRNVSQKLLDLLTRFEMDELLITTFSRDINERMDTYGLLAEI
ncbi:MsnO8 family LLM class oxidoreductase [Mucilaginibacter agri]|uniref:MsnO8 family LLM class oxidoreductase n=1 Tax=Mucilaginibacter agri TaxID=2695265 RepID=A0A966DR94_9SPHI|nr:MsnO8 family LLM class oxidoreductase [Mucilaginibacter agri]NCD68260.1 MsnO8 family LLM class oxidoreductase [Mucilaginibacter agri]